MNIFLESTVGHKTAKCLLLFVSNEQLFIACATCEHLCTADTFKPYIQYQKKNSKIWRISNDIPDLAGLY